MAIDWCAASVALEQSGRALMDAMSPGDDAIRRVFHRRMLQCKNRQNEAGLPRKVIPHLVCWLADERYGIEVSELLSVGRLSNFTPVWTDQVGVLGVTGWRSEFCTVVCLKHLLGLPCAASAQTGDFIIMPHHGNGRVALRIDGVVGIVGLAVESDEKATEKPIGTGDHVRGRTKNGVILVEMRSLVQHSRLAQGRESNSAWKCEAG